MKNPLQSERSFNLGLLLARLPVGVLFLAAGYGKVHAGVSGFVSSQIGNVPHWVSHAWGEEYLHGLPYVEITIGAMLILGLFGRLAGIVGALVVTSIMIGSTGFAMPGGGYAPHPNLIFTGLLLAIFLIGPGRFSLDGLMFGKGKRSVG